MSYFRKIKKKRNNQRHVAKSPLVVEHPVEVGDLYFIYWAVDIVQSSPSQRREDGCK